jgi:cobalt-zinc-cadmium efflux system protein
VQSSPGHLDAVQVGDALTKLDGVDEAHDVHLWTLTSGMEVASVHLTSSPGSDPTDVLRRAQALLADRFALRHVTVQVEPAGSDTHCSTPDW